MSLLSIHHVAIICADYARSRRFYVELLGLRVLAENFREARQSWKLDLALPDGGQIELFSFPAPPPRPSRPEAQGLRHLAFQVEDVAGWKARLEAAEAWYAGQPEKLEALDPDGAVSWVLLDSLTAAAPLPPGAGEPGSPARWPRSGPAGTPPEMPWRRPRPR